MRHRCGGSTNAATSFEYGATVIGMEYEYQRMELPRSLSRNVVRRLLTDAAEYGKWELDRLRLYPDGRRRVVLRRKIIRVRSTL
jgi:Family of unknown function (DUF5703)